MNRHLELIAKEIERINTMSADEYEALRNRRFKRMLLHHYENPYNGHYRDLLVQQGIEDKSELPATLGELDKLPIIDKEIIEGGNYARMPGLHDIEIYKRMETSGTMGRAFVVPHSASFALENMTKLIIRAQLMNDFDLDGKGYFVPHYYPGVNENFASYESLSLMHSLIGEDRIMLESTQIGFDRHLENLIKTQAVHSASSPHFYINFLSHFIADKRKVGKLGLRELLCGGAPLSRDDLGFLKQGLDLDKIILFYPTTDAGVIGTQIGEGNGYSVFSDHQVVEVVDGSGKQVCTGEKGTIIVTNLFCYSHPVIRYRIGDVVTLNGISKYNNRFVEIGGIQRESYATFGDGRISYDEMAEIPGHCRRSEIMAFTIQVIKRRNEERVDQPVIRIECDTKDREKAKEVVIAAFRENAQMDYLIRGNEIAYPQVEILKPGELTKGNFKAKIFIDET